MVSADDAGSATLDEGYRRLLRQRGAIVLGFLAALLVSIVLDVSTGPSNLPVGTVIDALIGGEVDRSASVIVWTIRLPYALIAVLVGASLALAGAEMQTILNNPLASPFTLGVSAAAAFGASLAIVLDLGIPGVPQTWLISANAFVFALLCVLMIQGLASWRGASVESLVLFGIALVFTFNALTSLMQFVASQEALQQLVFWTMGSLTRATWEKIAIVALALAVALPLALRSSWALTALRLGEDRAQSFGIDVGRLRLATMFRVSLLSALAVAFVGTIGFVGLVGPHIARLLVGEDHRFFLPASALCGALILSLASIASKMIIPGLIVPVGIVTALVGIPFFLWIILRRGQR